MVPVDPNIVDARKLPVSRFSHTSLSTWRRCRQKFYFQYIMKLKQPSNISMVRGSAGHAALGDWYLNRDKGKALLLAEKTWANYGFEWNDEWDLTLVAIERYLNYAEEHDAGWEFQDAELEFKLRAPFGASLIGFIDLIVKIDGLIWLVEHKFKKSVSTKNLELDAQVSMYLMAAQQMGLKPAGVIYNQIRVGMGPKAVKEPVERTQLFRDPRGLITKEKEVQNQIVEMQDWMAEPGCGAIYRNEIRDCSWDCGFFTACLEQNRSGSPQAELHKFRR